MRTHILPDGTHTKDAILYGKTWCALGDKICTLIPRAFMSGMNTMTLIIQVDGTECEMPASFALAIEKLIDNQIQG